MQNKFVRLFALFYLGCISGSICFPQVVNTQVNVFLQPTYVSAPIPAEPRNGGVNGCHYLLVVEGFFWATTGSKGSLVTGSSVNDG